MMGIHRIIWLSATGIVALSAFLLSGKAVRLAAPHTSRRPAVVPTARPMEARVKPPADVTLSSSDWPMWRHDAGRTAATPTALPRQLHLQWVLPLPELQPAWPLGDPAVTGTEDMRIGDGRQRRLTFDMAYAPIVVGDTMVVGSSRDDCLRAYDMRTGEARWHFYTDGPIRFAPAAWNGRIFVASDDGYLYCVDARNGALRWKFRGGPSGQKVIGNKRLSSMWPARGGPAVADGTVYFAAGLWPFMGTFLHALDADTGAPLWINDGSGQNFMQSPHSGAWSFNAIAPQGYIAVGDEQLLVPNGRAVAAAFDRDTGKLHYFHFAENNRNGTAHAAVLGPYWQGSCALFHTEDGSVARKMLDGAVLTSETFYEPLVKDVHDPGPSGVRARNANDLSVKWEYYGKMHTRPFCKAGPLIYAGSPGQVVAVEDQGESPQVIWQAAIAGTPRGMVAARGKLLVVTQQGCIHCFGAKGKAVTLPEPSPQGIHWPGRDSWSVRARAIVEATGQTEGYCLVLGVGTGRLMEELARQYPRLRVIGFEPRGARVESLRRRWHRWNIPHERLSVLPGDIVSAELPPYLANLMVSEDPASAGTERGRVFVDKVFHSLRPYGGRLCLPAEFQPLLEQAVAAGGLAGACVSRTGDYAVLQRAGALPGAADWTHQYADAANTVMSKDQLVKAPMGLLWYGGPSSKQILPRHRHGPTEQVVGGRLFIEGPGRMLAVDVYTGRILWQVELPGLGSEFVKLPIFHGNESHEPGANHLGSNYASASDGVYVAYGKQCLKLDPATGKTLATWTLPGGPAFAQVKIWQDLLVAAVDPLMFNDKPPGEDNWNKSCSKQLIVLDRHTGNVRWQRTADHAFHHNSIIAGQGMVFVIDRLPPGQEARRRRRGASGKGQGERYKLLALDAHNGQVLWGTSRDIFGTWLGLDEEEGVLIQSGRKSPDMVSGEPSGRIIAYRAKDGKVLWDKAKDIDDGPYLLAHGKIYMQNSQYSPSHALYLSTGTEVMTTHPLTGQTVPWQFMRNKGCNSIVGCENLLTFRSGTAAYYDLTSNSGVGSFGGFKSGCSTNLVPANGVLSAPDYTGTCNCSYQNQTSLALVHMPGVEVWTHGCATDPAGPIQRAGINFGAPGDHMAKDGTLWMEFPVPKYGDSPGKGATFPNVEVRTVPTAPEVFRHHSSRFAGGDLSWVAASGVIGLRQASVALGGTAERTFRVRLVFAEPESIEPGQRVFSVLLQDRPVLSDFDIVRAAGGLRRSVVKVFHRVRATDQLTVKLIPAQGSSGPEPLLCGIEIVAEPEAP